MPMKLSSARPPAAVESLPSSPRPACHFRGHSPASPADRYEQPPPDDAGWLVLAKDLEQLGTAAGLARVPRVVGKTERISRPSPPADLDHDLRNFPSPGDLPALIARTRTRAHVPAQVRADLPAHRSETTTTHAATGEPAGRPRRGPREPGAAPRGPGPSQITVSDLVRPMPSAISRRSAWLGSSSGITVKGYKPRVTTGGRGAAPIGIHHAKPQTLVGRPHPAPVPAEETAHARPGLILTPQPRMHGELKPVRVSPDTADRHRHLPGADQHQLRRDQPRHHRIRTHPHRAPPRTSSGGGGCGTDSKSSWHQTDTVAGDPRSGPAAPFRRRSRPEWRLPY